MPRKSVANSVVEDTNATVDNTTVVSSDTGNTSVESSKTENKNVEKKVNAPAPLLDTDEIAVESLVPNVSYLDKHTGDFYRWDEVGHVEYMTVEALKNMWRNFKGYFKNMWLKPLDNRIVTRFGLERTYENFEFLMNPTNYTRKNVDTIFDTISKTPNDLKFTILDKVKQLIVSGELTDAFIIKALEKHFDVDLMSFL